MNLGRLDREGVLYSDAPVVSTGGAVVQTLTREGSLRVSVLTQSSRDVLAGARDAEQTETVFQCRWFEGLQTGMVFALEGQTYRIVRRDQLGRREGWRFYGREIT